MHNATRRIRQIIALVLDKGYLAPDHAVAVAGKLLETCPLPDAFTLLGAAILRHAAILDPFKRETVRLAGEVNRRVPHQPFTVWLETAEELASREPIPESLAPPPRTASPDDHIAYLKAQPANSLRYPIMLRLWQSGDHETFEQAVQIMSASPTGLICAPTMAWGAFFANRPLLAHLLLEEGVPNFLGHALRARLAPRNERNGLLHAGLAAEPFQPSVLSALATGRGLARAHRTLGKPMRPKDLRNGNVPDLDAMHPRFIQDLDIILTALPPSAADFWRELRSFLG